MRWSQSHRFDAAVLPLANRHYNRQKIGSPQFAPPGSCFVLKRLVDFDVTAFWITSNPFAEYVRHDWAGAWVCSAFRNEGDGDVASELILEALAATRWFYGEPPPLGLITFVNPSKVPPVTRRGNEVYGYCFMKAGFEHVGFTKGGLWAWQKRQIDFPPAAPPIGGQLRMEIA